MVGPLYELRHGRRGATLFGAAVVAAVDRARCGSPTDPASALAWRRHADDLQRRASDVRDPDEQPAALRSDLSHRTGCVRAAAHRGTRVEPGVARTLGG